MEPTTTPASSNGATPDDLMKMVVRQHRIINQLREQNANIMFGLVETQATVEEVREELAVAQAENARLSEFIEATAVLADEVPVAE